MLNLFESSLVLPYHLNRLLQAVAMNRFDPMIGYGYAMAITSTLVQRFCKIRIGNVFTSEVGLYFLSIAQSGSGKGSMWKQLYAPIHDRVVRKVEADNEENKRREEQNAAINCIISEKKKQARKFSGPALEILTREIADLEAKKQALHPAYIFDVQDVTSAALLELLEGQETHSILIADTEGRFMRCIDEEKSLSAMLNQAFVGEPLSNSRASVRSIRVDNPHLSIVTAIQPEKLSRLTKNPHLWGEGFMARVLPYYARPFIGESAVISQIADGAIIDWWRRKVDALFHMNVRRDIHGRTQPYWVELDSEAYFLFERHSQSLQSMRTWPINLGLQPNLVRMPEQTARLAAIYHILEHPDPFGSKISGQIMQHAINASLFFIEQTRRLYAQFNPDPIMKLIPRVCGWLKSRIGTFPYVTAKDIYSGIGGDKSGLMRAIQMLLSQGVLYELAEVNVLPNFKQQYEVKSYGFGINFELLKAYPD